MTDIRAAVAAETGIMPVSASALQGGCVAEVYKLTFDPDNPRFETQTVVKRDEARRGILPVEARMLADLGRASDLSVPRVFHASESLLLMSFLPGKSRFNAKAQADAARKIAALHQVRGESFGYGYDTVIGGLHQPNPQTSSWRTFFARHRLVSRAQDAYALKHLNVGQLGRIERLASEIDRWIDEPPFPALLHGDLWTTNILADGDEITGFVDPAVYYGHPEIELAFTTLFNTFDAPFYAAYHDGSPIADGFWEVRKDLYNLYPLLTHVCLFGPGYMAPVLKTLSRLGY